MTKDLTVKEAGRLGGLATARKRPPEYFKEIGKRGGLKTATKGKEFYRKVGEKGKNVRYGKIAVDNQAVGSHNES